MSDPYPQNNPHGPVDRDYDRDPLTAGEAASPQPTHQVELRQTLTVDAILAADDIAREWVPCPEWAPAGSQPPNVFGVYVQALNGRERARWQQVSMTGQGKHARVDFQASLLTLVQMATVDAAGARLFIDDASVRALGKKSSAVLERINDVAMRLSGISEDETEALSGNSQTGSVGSSTD